MNREQFRGLGVALVTPFKVDGSLDEAGLRRLIDHQIKGCTDFLVPCGTTGENPALTSDEHLRVVRLTIEQAAGRVPVLAGAGNNSTPRAVELALAALDLGAQGLLTITPYYNKPNPDGLLRHFGAQAEALQQRGAELPMILYNVPGRTGLNMTAETQLRIAAEFPMVIGVKEASANLEQIMTILRDRPSGFLVLSGDDAWSVPLIALGADGLVSVVANEIPALTKQMVAAALAADFATARVIHNRILPLMLANFIESNPVPVKTVLQMMGIIDSDTLRSPLAPAQPATRETLAAVLRECGIESGVTAR